jgi:hypothetical protein
VYSVGPNSRPAATADAPRSVISDTVALPPLPDKPSIAVLPFQNMSGAIAHVPEPEVTRAGRMTGPSVVPARKVVQTRRAAPMQPSPLLYG